MSEGETSDEGWKAGDKTRCGGVREILYAYQSLNYTWWGIAHVILSEAVYAIRAINILVSDWNTTRGIARTRIYIRSRTAPSEIIVQLR